MRAGPSHPLNSLQIAQLSYLKENSIRKNIRDTVAYNDLLIQDRRVRGPYYYENHTNTVQCLDQWQLSPSQCKPSITAEEAQHEKERFVAFLSHKQKTMPGLVNTIFVEDPNTTMERRTSQAAPQLATTFVRPNLPVTNSMSFTPHTPEQHNPEQNLPGDFRFQANQIKLPLQTVASSPLPLNSEHIKAPSNSIFATKDHPRPEAPSPPLKKLKAQMSTLTPPAIPTIKKPTTPTPPDTTSTEAPSSEGQ